MYITLVVEDDLSGVVAERLVKEYIAGVKVLALYVAGGSVRGRIPGFNQKARFNGPVLVLADLDRPLSCPAELVQEMTRGLTVEPNLLIRVAVLEIEAWIMADRETISRWLGISARNVSQNPESLEDPKRALVQLASRSPRRRLRQDIAPDRVAGTNRTGSNYNDAVGEFVSHLWDPEAARRNSPSLNRAIARIAQLGTA